MSGGSCPSAKTCIGIFGIVVLPAMHAVCLSIGIIRIAAISGIIGQFGNLRTPSRRRTRVVCTLTATLSIYILMFVLAAQCLGTDVGRESDDRLGSIFATTLGRDDDYTVRSADTIKGRSCLTLQHVDTLNVLRINIDATVGEVGIRYRVTC